jgi:hypothetical protein
MNLLTIDYINGKKLTQVQKNFLKTLHDRYAVRVDTEEFEIRRNPVNGSPSHPLHPVVAALVDVVLIAYNNYSNGEMSVNGVKMAVGTFDRCKLLVLALDVKAYSALID